MVRAMAVNFRRIMHSPKVYDGGIITDAKNPLEEDIPMPRYRVEWGKYGKPLSDHRPIWISLKW